MDGPVKLVQGAPTRENLEFIRNWKESGNFHRALVKGKRHELEEEKRRDEREIDDMTYYFKGEKPYCLYNRTIAGGGRSVKRPPLRIKRTEDGKAVWAEVSPGRWRLVTE